MYLILEIGDIACLVLVALDLVDQLSYYVLLLVYFLEPLLVLRLSFC